MLDIQFETTYLIYSFFCKLNSELIKLSIEKIFNQKHCFHQRSYLLYPGSR